ncbi:MAG TPA: hypothetical protein VJV78_48655 [Polyangiales bacterium]|nr:hypothetical protein [Polyangiales bacterium]
MASKLLEAILARGRSAGYAKTQISFLIDNWWVRRGSRACCEICESDAHIGGMKRARRDLEADACQEREQAASVTRRPAPT